MSFLLSLCRALRRILRNKMLARVRDRLACFFFYFVVFFRSYFLHDIQSDDNSDKFFFYGHKYGLDLSLSLILPPPKMYLYPRRLTLLNSLQRENIKSDEHPDDIRSGNVTNITFSFHLTPTVFWGLWYENLSHNGGERKIWPTLSWLWLWTALSLSVRWFRRVS